MNSKKNLDPVMSALSVTAELTDTHLSSMALAVMRRDLTAYADSSVIVALERCRMELRAGGRLTVAEIIARIPDGHPEPNEAWGVALAAQDERNTLVWTPEIRSAWFGGAGEIYADGDAVGARMAFIETYRRLTGEAKASKRPARWEVSLGHDAEQRETAIQQAVAAGRLGVDSVAHLLPAPQMPALPSGQAAVALLISEAAKPKPMTPEEHEALTAKLAELREQLRKPAGQEG